MAKIRFAESTTTTTKISKSIFSLDSPLEEVTDSLYGKFRNFMMTHNLELKLPDMFFDGATFKISPRSIEGDGALVKLEFIPKDLADTIGSGRIFLKKISKFFLGKIKKKISKSPAHFSKFLVTFFIYISLIFLFFYYFDCFIGSTKVLGLFVL